MNLILNSNFATSHLIILSLLLPLIGSLGIIVFSNYRNLREFVTLLTASSLFFCVVNIFSRLNSGETPYLFLFELFPKLEVSFSIEPLGMIFGLLASGLWIVNSIYSIGYMRANNERNQTRFYVCFALAISSSLGIAFSGNLLTFFLFYELLTIITYPLVTHSGSSMAKNGGRIYLGFLLGTSITFLMFGIISIWEITGTLDFTNGGILNPSYGSLQVGLLLALFVFGIGKAALMPFHFWLPAAMVAPTPVSALLHAVAVVKAGVFGIIKVVIYIFGVETLSITDAASWLPYASGFTIITASIIALNSNNLKRRLAYSTVSQLSYIILAISMLNPYAIVASVFHLVAHAFGKITLFFAAGAIYTSLHKTEISELNGVGRQMPLTMIAFSLGVLCMVGLPISGGFISKWFLLSGAMTEGQWFILFVIFLSTLLNVAYFVPIIYRAFFLKPVTEEVLLDNLDKKHSFDHIQYKYNLETPIPILIALVTTGLGSVFLFFYPEPIIEFALTIGK